MGPRRITRQLPAGRTAIDERRRHRPARHKRASSHIRGGIESSYHAPLEQLVDAEVTFDSSNVLDRETGFKVDLFFLGTSQLDIWQLQRRIRIDLPGLVEPLWVTAAPDLILRKLWWFEMGGEVSDRQWRDIVSVLRVQSETIDTQALEADATAVGLGSLLDHALTSARR